MLAVLLVVGMFWAVETMAPDIAERTFTEATGFPTTVQDAEVSFAKQRISFSDIEIDNPSDFPDQEFLRINEFAVSLDRSQTNEDQLALGEVTLDIDELAFLEGPVSVSNLEAFFETAENNWDQILKQASAEAEEKGQSMPDKLVILKLNVSLNRVKLVNTSGPETVYRALAVDYARTFENVSEIRPVLESIAQDLKSKGLGEVAKPLEQADVGN